MDSTYAVILANGSFPKQFDLIEQIINAPILVCCDGALRHLDQIGRKPDIVIGDLDSLDKDLMQKYASVLIHVPDQNSNDLTKAVNWCESQSIKRILILGATGLREDHTIGNIALLAKYSQKFEVEMLTDYGRFVAINQSCKLQTEIGTQISIFSLNPTNKISSVGLKFPLNHLALQSWWMGTLNQAENEQIELIFEEGSSVIVYFANK